MGPKKDDRLSASTNESVPILLQCISEHEIRQRDRILENAKTYRRYVLYDRLTLVVSYFRNHGSGPRNFPYDPIQRPARVFCDHRSRSNLLDRSTASRCWRSDTIRLLLAFRLRRLDRTGIDGGTGLALCDFRHRGGDRRLGCGNCRRVPACAAGIGRGLQDVEEWVDVQGDDFM